MAWLTYSSCWYFQRNGGFRFPFVQRSWERLLGNYSKNKRWLDCTSAVVVPIFFFFLYLKTTQNKIWANTSDWSFCLLYRLVWWHSDIFVKLYGLKSSGEHNTACDWSTSHISLNLYSAPNSCKFYRASAMVRPWAIRKGPVQFSMSMRAGLEWNINYLFPKE